MAKFPCLWTRFDILPMVEKESVPTYRKQSSILGRRKHQIPFSQQLAGEKKVKDKREIALTQLGVDPQDNRIRRVREQFGMEQTALAQKTGMPLSSLKKVESNNQLVDPHELKSISFALGASPVSFCSRPAPYVLGLVAGVSDELKFVQHVGLSGFDFYGPFPKHDPPLASLDELKEDREVSIALERLIASRNAPYSEAAEAQIQAFEAIKKYTGKVVVSQIVGPGTGIMSRSMWFKFEILLIRNYQPSGADFRIASYGHDMSQTKFELARDNIDNNLAKRNVFEDLGLELMQYDSAKRNFETYQDHPEQERPEMLRQ